MLLIRALVSLCLVLTIPGQGSRSEDRPLRADLYGDPLPEGAIARLGTVRFRHRLIQTVAWSPDSAILASATLYECTIRLWDVATGKEPRRMPESATAIAWSPDGKTLASACFDESDNTIHLWDVATGKQVRRLEGDEDG